MIQKTALQYGGIEINRFIENMDQLHTAEMDIEPIKGNCQIETGDIVHWSKVQI